MVTTNVFIIASWVILFLW